MGLQRSNGAVITQYSIFGAGGAWCHVFCTGYQAVGLWMIAPHTVHGWREVFCYAFSVDLQWGDGLIAPYRRCGVGVAWLRLSGMAVAAPCVWYGWHGCEG